MDASTIYSESSRKKDELPKRKHTKAISEIERIFTPEV
ncbi:hypothetical protein T4D_15348 [Trichinella pseudospiralis]|uniref:Uncharacterized protein n=1 Tax=Trichinella pseudospiralis TaxID=6337 RepID=A0A0V1F3G6_TRIPS|nr:hypothetical protein T4D_15348 [Trichinella pseudospiralis]